MSSHKIDFFCFKPNVDINLRDYQQHNKENIYKAWQKYNSVMLQMPTGTGKTRLFVSLAKDLHYWGAENKCAVKILFLAHRVELIEQISNTLGLKYNLAHGIIMANNDERKDWPLQVGSVPTLNRRLDRWADKNFDIIVIDEAHHTTADSYKRILKTYPNAKVLGVTATPYRMSGVGFKEEYEHIIISEPVSKYIENKWLCDYDYYSIKPSSKVQKDIENIKLGFDGDYLESDMAATLDKDHIRAKIVDTYLTYAKGKKGIVYTINQQHNNHVCEQFNLNNIPAKAIDSKTPKEDRRQIIADFKKGLFDVLCNVNIFSEGFDCPDIEFVQLARPTKSLSMYLQQVGRGLRIFEGKERSIFLDNVGLYNRFGLPSANRQWRRHFEGKQGASEPEVVESNSTGERREVNWIEGDESIDMVFSTQEGNEYIKEFNNIEDFPILYIPTDAKIAISIFNSSFDLNDENDLFQIDNIINNTTDEYVVLDIDEQIRTNYDKSKYPFCCNFVCHSYKLISYNNKMGIYNDFKKEISIPCKYDEIKLADIFGRSIVKIGKFYGLVNVITGETILSPQYDHIELNYNDNEFFVVNKRNKIGIVKRGDIVAIDYIYEQIEFVEAENGQGKKTFFFNALHGNNYDLVTHNFGIIKYLSHKRSKGLLFNGNYFIQKYKNYYGLTNKKNEIVCPFIFDGFIKLKDTENFFIGQSKRYGNNGLLFDSKMEIVAKINSCANLRSYKKYTILDGRNEDGKHYWYTTGCDGKYLETKFETRSSIKIFIDDLVSKNVKETTTGGSIINKPLLILSEDVIQIANVGDTVFHPRFKKGIVTKTTNTHEGRMVTVKFENFGEKKLMLKYAKLKLVLS